jgi:predicted RNase H-like HicB family nuclease
MNRMHDQATIQDLSFTVHIFKEGDTFVAYVPALDVSSCGATDEDARRNIRDALRAFLETSAEMGTLDEVLQESGYVLHDGQWEDPEFVSLDRLAISIP